MIPSDPQPGYSQDPPVGDTLRSTLDSAIRSDSIIMREILKQDMPLSSQATIRLVDLGIKAIYDDDVKLLINAEKLSLRKNQIASLPKSFALLKDLRYLDLTANCIREIPSVLEQCPRLEILDLSSNKIRAFPLEVSPLWRKNLKVLSLRNNRISSIEDLRGVAKLNYLNVLDLEGNNIPAAELAEVQRYVPFTPSLKWDEYWAIALRKYFRDHPNVDRNIQEHGKKNAPRTTKRMGFIRTIRSDSLSGSQARGLPDMENVGRDEILLNNGAPLTRSPGITQETTSSPVVNSSGSGSGNVDLYNYTKYNDYFKRLSVLPEEYVVNEQRVVSHSELIVACRKLLFSFTECQQAIRKIASFCKDKSIAVNVVSLLYSVRSHIDSLVELLQQSEAASETKEKYHDQGLLKLCVTITTIFKQVISVLRKDFDTFFGEDELCFIRMFYMTLLCSYNEIYNAWSFLSPNAPTRSTKAIRKMSTATKQVEPQKASFTAIVPTTSTSSSREDIGAEILVNSMRRKSRMRSNTLSKLSTSISGSRSHALENVVLKTTHPSATNLPLDVGISSPPQANFPRGSTPVSLSSLSIDPNNRERMIDSISASRHANELRAATPSAIAIQKSDSPIDYNATPTTHEKGIPISRSLSTNTIRVMPSSSGGSTSGAMAATSTGGPAMVPAVPSKLVPVHSGASIAYKRGALGSHDLKVALEQSPRRTKSSAGLIYTTASTTNEAINVIYETPTTVAGTNSSSNNGNKGGDVVPHTSAGTVMSSSGATYSNLTPTDGMTKPPDGTTHTPVSVQMMASVPQQPPSSAIVSESGAVIDEETQQKIDEQLSQTLLNVIKVVNIVYNQISAEISKITSQQVLNETLASKVRELMETCSQAMELSDTLKTRLELMLSKDVNIIEVYSSSSEKLKVWEKINSFLKVIISILGSTKTLMADLPELNEIRPNLSALTKVTKDVTVLLDLSSYKSTSVTAAQIQKQQIHHYRHHPQ